MKGILISFVAVLTVVLCSCAALAAEIDLVDGTKVIYDARQQQYGPQGIVLKGNAKIKVFSKAQGTSLIALGEKITVTFFSDDDEQEAAGAVSMIKSVEFSGSPRITSTETKEIVDKKTSKKLGQVTVTTKASADLMAYSGTDGIVTLTGNVKIERDDPSMFKGTGSGEKAWINLSRDPNREFDFRIETANVHIDPDEEMLK